MVPSVTLLSMRFLGLGGTDEVGASSYLYELDGVRLLVDAGVRPTMMGEASLPSFDLLEEGARRREYLA